MLELGYWLSSEQRSPAQLVQDAQRAEEIGFAHAMISDHYHPWIGHQGHSPFVWSVIGGIAATTRRIPLGTGVTCPLIRIHPAIIAQAAATSAAMMEGRFFLGVGTGENINEHIVGQHWPPAETRIQMLEEAVAIIRKLWQEGFHSHHGRFFTVENAAIFTRPQQFPPIMVAASGPRSASLAGRIGDGLVTSGLEPDVVRQFDQAGGSGKPRYGRYTVCWAETYEQARQTAYHWWRSTVVKGQVKAELPLPSYFEQLSRHATEDTIAQLVICGPDPAPHIQRIREFADAGYDHVNVHQVGPDQEGFFRFYQSEILPEVNRAGLAATVT